ncbi:hypothetical protein OsI_13472 [Oryza sativa Indica Group]|uniref:Uncharacterized protein n=1 Tax=Oryza sativa subsp. indica TaxID=39946 RepID=B8AJU6_ORYSI|nr:hypothetical protein OsI_13472 [Oryza sativa Indica Group]
MRKMRDKGEGSSAARTKGRELVVRAREGEAELDEVEHIDVGLERVEWGIGSRGEEPVEIREVWMDNLEVELALIRDVVDEFPFVAMDTEFPGIVCCPRCRSALCAVVDRKHEAWEICLTPVQVQSSPSGVLACQLI